MIWSKSHISTGMFVTSTKGERLGKVIRCDNETFVVEKGSFFPKDYQLRYDHIKDTQDGTIKYSLSEFVERETRSQAPGGEPRRLATAGLASGGVGATGAVPATLERERVGEKGYADKEEVRIPLMREEVDVEKVSRETGHVRVHKTVKTEERHFTVPVMHEEVVIEHVAGNRDAPLAPREYDFKEQTIDVALHEEELRISKHPVLREEVVLRTKVRSVEKEGTTSLRSEEVEIEDTRKTPGARVEEYSTSHARR